MGRAIDTDNRLDDHETIEPDEEFTPPAGKRKKTTKKAKAVATT